MMHGMETVADSWYVKEEAAVLYTRIYYVKAGAVVYRDGTGSTALKHRHLYFFPTNQPYEMTQDKKNKLQCIFCHRVIAPLVVPRLIGIDGEKDLFVKGIVQALSAVISKERGLLPEEGLETGMLAEDLMGLLVRYAAALGLLTAMPEAIAAAVRHIHGSFGENIRVEALAALSGYHEKYFIRKFKEATGMSPHGYLISCRLDAACGILLEGNSVARAAEICGYPDAKSFSRAFKQRFGVSPGLFSRFTRPV